MEPWVSTTRAVCGGSAGARFAHESGRLLRSRSAEDLSQEQLKTTESDTVLIFIEYVRNKLDKSSHPRAAELDAELEAESRRRREGRGRTRDSLRRLHSEPNGPKIPELQSRNGEYRDGAVRQVPATNCDFATAASPPRPTALVLDRPPSNRDERRQRASQAAATRSISNASSNSDTTTTPSHTLVSSGLSSTAATPVPIPDPPLCVGAVSPHEDGDFAASYPPLYSHRMHTVVSSPAIPSSSSVLAGRPVSQEYYCTAQQV